MNLATEKQTLKSTFASAQGAEAQRLALEIRDNVVLMAETPRIYLVCTNLKYRFSIELGRYNIYLVFQTTLSSDHRSICHITIGVNCTGEDNLTVVASRSTTSCSCKVHIFL